MARSKSLLLGFVVGGVVTATTTLLSTPASGKDMRLRMKQQSLEWKELFENLMRDSFKLKDQLTKTSKEGSSLIKNLTKEMKVSITEWKASVQPHQENIKHYLEEIESSLKDLEDKIKKD
ncbi:YtxH domain-containing protein [Virgibacillus soli]|uniref:YtxH domain-containing protein n=1 Tax=Paracerasibacillus soli TaxID=480284 RepID=A0ABU5CN87_9BACI|nr:YtxH domain-containing protein [Virgibacillus soli]MDY0407818.1 YtxH domain-containing protein [Virgibacillus soli]